MVHELDVLEIRRIVALPYGIHEKVWGATEIGCGRRTILYTEAAHAEASDLLGGKT